MYRTTKHTLSIFFFFLLVCALIRVHKQTFGTRIPSVFEQNVKFLSKIKTKFKFKKKKMITKQDRKNVKTFLCMRTENNDMVFLFFSFCFRWQNNTSKVLQPSFNASEWWDRWSDTCSRRTLWPNSSNHL